ncbi:dUTP diphosphatase [Enteractinococcus coprophilus]|uniref:Deoxyuridine 5'-triphosphate nucleotidohydrolase n=1 Tax=Enteractinococcus coprophilus TaxID=1027633 RepID=A0A543AJL4_9MICC|nr:dUTP diphosphatase [Enteractinococcus coprophilus]TQL72788.1 dUTP pyrophosphatase [Enteractinococcus coprophilus]
MPTSSDRDRSPHQLTVELKLLDDMIAPPAYALPGDAGADLVTTIDVTLAPGQRQLVPTGVAVAIPHGFAGFVHPRSGLATRAGLSIVNAPGTIDAGYRGEIKVALINLDSKETIQLQRGERIAQLVIQPVYQAEFSIVEELPESIRQDAGFGSTGSFGTRQ